MHQQNEFTNQIYIKQSKIFEEINILLNINENQSILEEIRRVLEENYNLKNGETLTYKGTTFRD